MFDYLEKFNFNLDYVFLDGIFLIKCKNRITRDCIVKDVCCLDTLSKYSWVSIGKFSLCIFVRSNA